MTPYPRPLEQVNGSTGNHPPTVQYKVFKYLLQIENLGLIFYQGNNIDTEYTLQLSLCIEIIQYNIAYLATPQFNNYSRVGGRFITELRDPLNFLVFHQLRNLFEEPGTIHLVRNFFDNNRLLARLFILFNITPGANLYSATTCPVCLYDAATTVNDSGGRKIRSFHIFHQTIDIQVRILNQSKTGIDYFGQVMWRYICRHTNGDTTGAIDQQIGNPRRQYFRHLQSAIIVINEINCFLVKVSQQFMGDLLHADFGVSHSSCIVAIERAKITLTVNKRVAHTKILRHAHDGIVGSVVAMWVILTDDITNNPRRLHVGTIESIVQVIHGEQHSPMHGLQAIANIRQGPAYDDAHCVVKIRLAQFIFNIDGRYMVVKIRHLSLLQLRRYPPGCNLGLCLYAHRIMGIGSLKQGRNYSTLYRFKPT